ncbi:MAG: antibiotic biosynthesis monooxygenase [Nitrospiraceae bacterium]|nr:antibiotic biosynthesis monooxygenase [Nitrospiraceae bacterium]
MNHDHPSSSTLGRGATAVITHRVRDGQQEGYEAWLNEIGPLCRSYPGHLDLQIIRPIPGLTATYTVIIRFDTREHLQGWMSSQDRKRLIEQVRPLLAQDDDFFIRSGLDFWFTPEGARAKVPVRWKQFLVTWSAIFPLVLVIPMVVAWGLRQLGVPHNHYLDLLLSTGSVVGVMVYLVMPHYTKLIQRWLFT